MTRVLAWGVLAVTLMLTALGGTLTALNGAELTDYFIGAMAVVFTAPGALLAARRPRHPIGWILCAVGGFQGVLLFSLSYGAYALLTRPGSLPGGAVAAWLSQFVWMASIGPLFTFLLLLFPTGHLPSPRWRWVAWAAGLAIATAIAASAVGVWPLRGAAALGDIEDFNGAQVAIAAQLVVAICAVASVASLLVRFRRAHGDERQQLKWFGFAALLTVVGLVAWGVQLEGGWGVLLVVGMLAPPIAIAVAVLRYRLYDLDRLIRRTAAYALLTALLGGAYLIAVTVLQTVLNPVVGQSQLAVAASTLAVAALFRPLRRRVQSVVDRRFDRRRYDAARSVEAFRGTLRDALDLDALSDSLLTSVHRTVQPAGASLWLRRTP